MISIPLIRIAWGITHKIYDIMTRIFRWNSTIIMERQHHTYIQTHTRNIKCKLYIYIYDIVISTIMGVLSSSARDLSFFLSKYCLWWRYVFFSILLCLLSGFYCIMTSQHRKLFNSGITLCLFMSYTHTRTRVKSLLSS